MKSFKGQTAVVTGGGSGIGRAISLALAEREASLVLVGRTMKTLDSTADSAGKNSPDVSIVKADLTHDGDLKKVALHIRKNHGNVDMLIHSAGAFSMGPVSEASAEDFDRQFRTNVRAPFLLTQILLPWITKSKGQIVFINSSVGLSARGQVSQYAATKHALKALADCLREEVNEDGIRVISIFPGRTATPMQEHVHKLEGRRYVPDLLLQPADVAQVVMNALGTARTSEVTDITVRPMIKSL